MRGTRISRAARKDFDIVVVAARYNRYGRLRFVQAYKRMGLVWHDIQVLNRQTLVDYVKQDVRVAAGAPSNIAGDFEIFGAINFKNERDIIAVNEDSRRDELQVPLY